MDYADLVSTYKKLEATSATLEKRTILAHQFTVTDPAELSAVVRLARGKVFAPWEGEDLGVSTALASEAIAKATGINADRLENWWREEGDLGDVAAKAVSSRTQQTLLSTSLTVNDVYNTLRDLATYEGTGSQSRQVDTVAGLVSEATSDEARYIVRTIVGAMRLGVGEGIIRDALADAYLDGSEAAIDAVEHGYQVTNDFAIVADRARNAGRAGLNELNIELFRPIKPMLAGTADDVETALADLGDDNGTVLVETKYDGIRAKIHHVEGETRVFTRRLEDVTKQFPDVVDAVEGNLNGDEYIVEAELVGYDPATNVPVPFQRLSQRIKRKYDIHLMVDEIPITVYLFDMIFYEGESYLDTKFRDRVRDLEQALTPIEETLVRADHIRTDSVSGATEFYEEALEAGHEGVMIKNLDATYQPGSRVGYQRKLKPTMEPLDLVVTRAKWSEGRKSDYLGRPYLACRGPAGEFLEVGRMHTGFTDEDLETFTDLVEPLITSVDGREAKLEPKVVLEVEYEEVQESSKYDSGFALRFPRLVQIRHDLSPGEADTIDRVKALYEEQE